MAAVVTPVSPSNDSLPLGPFAHCLCSPQYSYAVSLVRSQLQDSTGMIATNVLFTTDEADQTFLDELAALGWKGVTSEIERRIRRDYGDW